MPVDPEKNRARAKAWYWANRERAAESRRQRIAADPEKAREQNRRSGEKYRASENGQRARQKWLDANRDYQREQYVAKREQEIEKALRWQKQHPERARELKREHSRRRKQRDPQGESDRFRRMKMARLHGMQPEDWAVLWDAQGGRCYLCGDELIGLSSRNVHVDHDHRCCAKETSCAFCRRGLACFRCNAAIGMALDDPDRLRRIADNLAIALADVAVRLAQKPQQLTLDAS